jgi:thiamine-phosphate pyrophosphorylase
VCKRVSIPVIAIGGINRDNIKEVMRAGAQGVAVVSAISEATDPKRAAQELFEKINATINEAL